MSAVPKALEALIRVITEEAVTLAVNRALAEQARRQVQNAQALSANQAARLAKCRRVLLVAALESGALRGLRLGRRWTVMAGDVQDWVRAGRPIGHSHSDTNTRPSYPPTG